MKKYNRNEFLKLAGIGIPTAVYGIETKGIFYPERGATQPWQLAVDSYTFHDFNLDETIKMTLRLGISAISLKSMHMPLESSTAELQQISGKVRAAGLDLYGAGVIYMKTAREVEDSFSY